MEHYSKICLAREDVSLWGGGAKYFVPLQFWFCRNPGLALPLIALQYHEVKVILNHQWQSAGPFTTAAFTNKLFCDYIYLDTDERRRFAQVSHEYLIEQVQGQSLSDPDGSNDLNFNHPVKELIWTRSSSSSASMDPRAVGTGTYQLKLNGHDRFAARDYRCFHKNSSMGTPYRSWWHCGKLNQGIRSIR